MEAGAFASLVDFDSYWHPNAMTEADKFCTDDLAQLRYYEEVGYFQGDPAHPRRPGRTGDRPKAGARDA